MSLENYFADNFYDMKPYLSIDKDQWKFILSSYEKEDIIDELAKCLWTYPCPIPKISDEQTRDSFNKLKGVRYNDVLIDGKWFPRNDRKSNYKLDERYFKRDNTGNNASNKFHIENRWKVDWTRTPSGYKTWQTIDGIKTIVRAFFTLDKVLLEVNEQTLRMATTLRKYVASQFKPSIAKAFYDYYKSKNVLDFSAGWGDRLAGFYACDNTQHYVGIDPNTKNHIGYKKQVEFYKNCKTFLEDDKKVDMICSPAEDVDYSQYEDYFDTIFTSPPYFNTEKYCDEPTQSYIRYKEIDDWNKNFLHKTICRIVPTLKPGGILAINIADVFSAKHKGYVDITNSMNDYIKSCGLKYVGCIGMEMTKRFNSGGAGQAKSDYYSEDLKETTEKKKDYAFGEPIWVWTK